MSVVVKALLFRILFALAIWISLIAAASLLGIL